MTQMQNNSTLAPQKKVTIADIGIPIPPARKTIQIGNAFVSVLPVAAYEDILDTMQWAINSLIDDRTYISAPLEHVITELSIIKLYTDIYTPLFDEISFAAKDVFETYDILFSNDAFEKIFALIDKEQLHFYRKALSATSKSIIDYRNSMAGILERLSTQAKDDNGNMESILAAFEDEKTMGVAYKMLNLMQEDQVRAIPTPSEIENVENADLAE